MHDSAGAASTDRRSIAKAAAIAFVVAALVLVAVVLPAEYGVDPLGTGRPLGLLDIYNARTATAPPITPTAGGPLFPQNSPFRVDSRTLVVPSLGSLEFKYELTKGTSMTYSWRATAQSISTFTQRWPVGRMRQIPLNEVRQSRGTASTPPPMTVYMVGTGRT